jgi:nicotinamidase-related amidase
MAGTPGQQKIAETLLPSRLVVPNHPIELPDLGAFQQIILEKQAFDVFTNPNAGKVLRRFGENPSVVLYGVATDICVAATALSLLARGHRVRVVVDAIAALEQKNAEAFFREFRQRGGELIQAETIVHRRAA